MRYPSKSNRLRLLGLAIFLMLSLVGCTTGNKGRYQLNAEKASQISNGQTTKAEIVAAFGKPHRKGYNLNGDEFYIWSRLVMRYGPNDNNSLYMPANFVAPDKSYSLNILFDQNDIVKDFSYVEADGTGYLTTVIPESKRPW